VAILEFMRMLLLEFVVVSGMLLELIQVYYVINPLNSIDIY
jgi:hypothetical protein